MRIAHVIGRPCVVSVGEFLATVDVVRLHSFDSMIFSLILIVLDFIVKLVLLDFLMRNIVMGRRRKVFVL